MRKRWTLPLILLLVLALSITLTLSISHLRADSDDGWIGAGPSGVVNPQGNVTDQSSPIPPSSPDPVEMVHIPAGEFTMGSNDGDDDEKPPHRVYVDAFYIDKYEVTNARYRKFVEATGHREPSHWGYSDFNQPNQPVVKVSWYDAMAYAEWAGKRLPTEAEWEKAARGTNGRTYPWGNGDPNSRRANYNGSVGSTAVVGSYPGGASPYGVMDMAGNAWEWCLDKYQYGFYRTSSARAHNPIAGDRITYLINNFINVKKDRVLRGGSWHFFNGAFDMRAADRTWIDPAYTNYLIGFRCVSPRSP